MLRRLRAEALALIAVTPECTLSTAGPAGLQASFVGCAVRDGCVYLLVPSSVDQLLNLEHGGEVILTSALWQLRGAPLVLSEPGVSAAAPRDLREQAAEGGMAVVEIFPVRIHLEPGGRRRHRVTVDIAPDQSDPRRRLTRPSREER